MRVILMAVIALLLSGCGSWPQNPEEFREMARKNPIHKMVDTFEVERPLHDVAAVMRKKSAECLDATMKLRRGVTRSTLITYDAGTITYKPTFTSRAKSAELDVQRQLSGTSEKEVGQVPPGGAYRVVMDATAVSANRTRIDIYRITVNGTDDAIRDAMTHWAKGDALGCPVLNVM